MQFTQLTVWLQVHLNVFQMSQPSTPLVHIAEGPTLALSAPDIGCHAITCTAHQPRVILYLSLDYDRGVSALRTCKCESDVV